MKESVRKWFALSLPKGFTLVELLVVVAIMALIGIVTLANYKSFGEDQILKQGILDIQSRFRNAQASSTSNYKCGSEFSAVWQVEFTSTTNINLKCKEPSGSVITKYTPPLDPNLVINSISGIGAGCTISSPPFSSPFPTVNFAPLTGLISFGEANCTSLTITLRNTKTSATKSLTIEKGGKINE